MAAKPLSILCFDGGGVRGLSSLLILRDLMRQLQTTSQLQAAPLPCEVFDMICGTSTGGIIALMLGRLRMSVEEVIVSYIEFSKTVFKEKHSTVSLHRVRSLRNRLWRHKSRADSAKYDAYRLEKWVKLIVGKHGGNKQASIQDPLDGTDKCCRTFVVAVRQLNADSPPKRFRTYTVSGKKADQCKIWEAARATTAAAPFFSPTTFGSPPQTYVGGALSGANNPSQLAVDEAGDVFPSRKIGCFLSLGTGVPADVISVQGDHDDIANACMELIESCERVHHAAWKHFARNMAYVHGPYFRFSVDRGLGTVKFDEWNGEESLTAITDGYMRNPEEEQKARRCIDALKTKTAES